MLNLRCALAAIMCCTLHPGASSAAPDPFSARARTYLARIAERQQPADFAIVTARLATGRHRAEALAQLDSLLDHPTGDMFFMYASMGCLSYLRDSLAATTRDKFRTAWKSYTFYRGDTENHFLMYYAGLYLAAQEWPGLAGREWFNGKSSDENMREAREYLMQWSLDVAKYGMVEFDSPRYMYYFLTPLLLLQHAARDSVMKTRATLMLDYLFTDFASEYLPGAYCGAHSRDGESSSIAPRTAEAISYAGLYFGDIDVERPLQDVAFGALASYRLPEIIRAVAVDKPQALVHREARRARKHIRFDGDPQPVVFKYDFMTPDFCLGSMQGTVVQPIQQRSWSLVFNSTKPHNNFFALHPTHSATELATFFPEEAGLLVGDIGKSKQGYASEDKWIGGSAYERIKQDKNTLIALYDIPANDPVDHIDYFIPDLDFFVRDSSGWYFMQSGDSYAALFPLRPVIATPGAQGMRLRSTGRRNGYVVVAMSKNLRPQIKTFAAFMSEIRLARVDTTQFAARGAVTAKIGNRAAFTFAYGDAIAGDSSIFSDSEFSYLRAKLSRAPHVQSERGTGVIEISRPGETLVLDFTRNAIEHHQEHKY